ncbi:guanylate kinase [Moheibacter sediminis]|uniref:Guanylate kinase n=1 Tax=Moheibacter sediminis TaxID=1434700 RepID=A0A1W1Y8D3_9FLAO|nr:guanylate kinase [Moheibacter sediminis]SMC32081.1 guanylate kinase [Moheibacter sediminis]
MSSGKLIIVSAPSGAGKTTLVKHLLENLDSIEFSVSCATRGPRENEIHGKDYYFISAEEFKQKVENQEFAEWEEVYAGSYYGTLKSEIQRIWAKGKSVIFDIDVDGGINLKNIYPTNSLSVFIMPPSVEELERRLRARNTESEDKLQMRVEKAEKELLLASKFDTILVNEDLEKSKKEIVDLISGFLN